MCIVQVDVVVTVLQLDHLTNTFVFHAILFFVFPHTCRSIDGYYTDFFSKYCSQDVIENISMNCTCKLSLLKFKPLEQDSLLSLFYFDYDD